MIDRNTFWTVISYALWSFFPLILPLCVVIPGLLLNAFIAPAMGESLWLPLLLMLGILFVFTVTIWLGFRFSVSFPGFRARVCIAYIGWLVLGGLSVFFVAAAIGGTSQAVVEGDFVRADFIQIVIWEALILFAMLQFFIVPWVLFSTWRTTRLFVVK